MAFTYREGTAKREEFGAYAILDKTKLADFTFTKADLELIGIGIEDMPISMNVETEESQDVCGNSNYDIVAYAETMEITPIKIKGESKFSQWLDEAIERRYTLDELVMPFLFVKKYKTDSSGNYAAFVQALTIEPTSFANGLNGVSNTVTAHFTGERFFGTVDKTTLAFTEEGASLS